MDIFRPENRAFAHTWGNGRPEVYRNSSMEVGTDGIVHMKGICRDSRSGKALLLDSSSVFHSTPFLKLRCCLTARQSTSWH